ncbi:MAG: DUF2764 domain-containing protein [Tannerellaceae bacterium]|nr:DUF2764 domain-containing protein [Tannerellaceae bacterium]MCD8264298.1 DUF2764 domain-containing protein [Tannerellaceae bacterium]
MSKYYYLVAGLPNIALGDSKLTYTITDFRRELDGVLSSGDQKLIDLFFLKFDNANLLTQLQWPDRDSDERGTITNEELQDLVKLVKDDDNPPANTLIPPYFTDFLRSYFANEGAAEGSTVSWEDRLATHYYAYAMKSGNEFVSSWFELNLNINNILTAYTCRKYNLDKADYIIGDNEIAEAVRLSNTRDFGLGDTLDYLPALQRIAEEPNLVEREKKLDLLKWEWLDEYTFFKPFDVESVFAYLLKLEMIERWLTLDKETGEQTFREIVGSMKKGSKNVLEEFKRNNNK